MTMLGDVPAASIIVDDIEDHFRLLADDGAGPRTVNRRREVLRADLQLRLLGELLRIACYCGLGRGELVLLHWDDVRRTDRVLIGRRALSGGVEVLPKCRRARYVPLADQALAAFERLARRGDFTQPDDYVFINAVGGHLDPSALRRRYVRVRDTAGLPRLRFHDLRHTAGSLLVRHMDPASVKDILGHADLVTTERHLHAQRASLVADPATRAFTPNSPPAPDEQLLARSVCATPPPREGIAAPPSLGAEAAAGVGVRATVDGRLAQEPSRGGRCIHMRRRRSGPCTVFLLALLTSLVTAATAVAVPPAITAVAQEDRHPAVKLAAPRAASVTVYIASEPDRATDGSFLQENVVEIGFLTDSEIQSGQWTDSSQIEPGSYFVMLKASSDFTSCVSYDPNTLDRNEDPACADGFSSVVPLSVPTPQSKYTVKTELLKNIGIVYLTLTGEPLGVKAPYQVCWRQPVGKKKTLAKRCVKATLGGYSWNSDASDLLSISTKGMTRRTKFTWYARGGATKMLISKTITLY